MLTIHTTETKNGVLISKTELNKLVENYRKTDSVKILKSEKNTSSKQKKIENFFKDFEVLESFKEVDPIKFVDEMRSKSRCNAPRKLDSCIRCKIV